MTRTPPRLAAFLNEHGQLSAITTDCRGLEVYLVDDTAEADGDRVYRPDRAVNRISPAQFRRLIAGRVRRLKDRPEILRLIPPALRHGLDSKDNDND